MAHKLLPTPGKIKDYGVDWIEAVKRMQTKIKSSKNELHRLILSLYTDTMPRRSLDYAHMQINIPNNKEDNILIFTPKETKFIFNKYKVSNKKGAQEIPIVSAPLIKILEEHLKKYPNQKYLLMRNDQALNDQQIREVIRTEMGSKETPFGVQMIRRLFATHLIQEKKANPREFKEYARKMGMSVEMLMSNYTQIPDKKDKEEYQGVQEISLPMKKNLQRSVRKNNENKSVFVCIHRQNDLQCE